MSKNVLVCSLCGKESDGTMKCCPRELVNGDMDSSYEYKKNLIIPNDEKV